MMILVRAFPDTERFKLIDQTTRASRSATNNIAEGFGRYTYREYINFLVMSRGSLTELIDQLIIAVDEGYMEEAALNGYKDKVFRGVMVINGLIRYLRKAKPGEQNAEEAYIPYNTQYPAHADD